MKKSTIIFMIFVLAGIGVWFFYVRSHITLEKGVAKNVVTTTNKDNNLDTLVILPQIPQGKVIVQSATLPKPGFVVVRQVDDGKVSQIIEMSKPLKPGVNKDITIPVTSEEINGKELIVMLYEDYGKDGIFNDLDMPLLTQDGFMTARFVKTGKPLPSDMTEDPAMQAMSMAGMKAMAKVHYADNGFSPNKVEINVGDMVEFVNDSSTVMWVASMPHPSHTKLPTFDQFRAYKKGAIYRYVFDKKGTWEYHDHINPSRGGVVVAL